MIRNGEEFFKSGIYDYGKNLFNNECGLVFKDGSFLVGISGMMLNSLKKNFGHEDKWVKENKNLINNSSFGVMFLIKMAGQSL